MIIKWSKNHPENHYLKIVAASLNDLKIQLWFVLIFKDRQEKKVALIFYKYGILYVLFRAKYSSSLNFFVRKGKGKRGFARLLFKMDCRGFLIFLSMTIQLYKGFVISFVLFLYSYFFNTLQ